MNSNVFPARIKIPPTPIFQRDVVLHGPIVSWGVYMTSRDKGILPEKHEIDKGPFGGLSWGKNKRPDSNSRLFVCSGLKEDTIMSEDSEFLLKTVIEQSRSTHYPAVSPDKYFEIFSAEQVLKYRRFNPDPTEIESGVVGGDGDGGVDGFYLFVNRKLIREDTDITVFKDQQLNIELVIIQAKHKASFEESVPMKLKDFTEHCLRLNADIGAIDRLLYSESLLTLVNKFHDTYKPALALRPKLSINIFHVSLADTVDPKVEARAILLVNKVKEFFPTSECLYDFIRGHKLLEFFQQQPERTLPLITPRYFDWKSFEKSAYACVVKLPDFYNFITDNGALREYMFEANVRDHAPDVKVNKGIRTTLIAPENDDFWWLNNGITILASNVSYHDGALQVTDPLIVNGLQTSYEVCNHFLVGGSKDDKRALMVKVIVNIDDETSDRIINATNSQTKIESINLHATEQIHRNIELALKAVGLFYDRRKNFYRNKGESAAKIITIGYMSQAIAAIVLQQPDHARARPTTVAQKNYKYLFSTEYPIMLYPKCAQIMKRIDSYLDGTHVSRGTKLNLVFYLSMYATCAVLHSVKPTRIRIASLDLALLTDSLLAECYTWLEDKFTQFGGDDKAAKGSSLTAALKQRVIEQYGTKGK
jgi:hypothetical protein